MEDKNILDAARRIRPHLQELVGEESGTVDQKLADHLAGAADDSQKAADIVGVVREYERARWWLREYLNRPATTRAYDPLAGDPEPGSPPEYQCPVCRDYVWYRRRVGDAVPQCPIHHVSLAPVEG